MRLNILSFILIATGSFIIWLSNGLKGKFNDYMTGPYDSSIRAIKRMFVGILTLGILFISIFNITSKLLESQKQDYPIIITLDEKKIRKLDSLFNDANRQDSLLKDAYRNK